MLTASDFQAIRARLGLTRQQLADALRLRSDGAAMVERIEEGREPISGPLSLAMEALGDGWRPAQSRVPDSIACAAFS